MASSFKQQVFLIDDEPIQSEMLKDFLSERFNFQSSIFEDGEEALKNMTLKPEIVVLDYHLNSNNPDAKNGVEILKAIKEASPETNVIMLSGQDNINVAVDTIKYGAYDYVVKGETAFHRIGNIINNIEKMYQAHKVNKGYKSLVVLLIIVEIISLLICYFVFIKPRM